MTLSQMDKISSKLEFFHLNPQSRSIQIW
jgi:hypothetical protein